MDKLEGLELRKAALTAAGWKCQQKDWDGLKTYGVVDPDGVKFGSTHYATPKQAWQHAPAVESSVDAALQWLTLGAGCYWQLDGPVSDPDTQGSSLASIVDINSSMERVTVGNPATPEEIKAAIKFNKPLAEADAETMPDAMCRAYVQYKAGA